MRWVLNVIAENRNSSVGSGWRGIDHAPSGRLGGGAVDGQRHRLGRRVAVDERLLLADAAHAVLVVLVLDDDEQQRAAGPGRGARRAHGRHPLGGRADAQVAVPLEPPGAPHPAGERGHRRRGQPRVAVGTESGGRRRRREERPVPQRRQRRRRRPGASASSVAAMRATWAASSTAVERAGHAEVVEGDLVGHRSGRSGDDAAVAQARRSRRPTGRGPRRGSARCAGRASAPGRARRARSPRTSAASRRRGPCRSRAGRCRGTPGWRPTPASPPSSSWANVW